MKTATAILSFLLAMCSALNGQSSTAAAPNVKPAIDGVLGLFQQKSVVVLCDEHGLAQEEDFYSALVRDPRFAENVQNLIVEFGGESSQAIIDRYVNGEDVPVKELRRVWTETPGWVPGPTRIGYINVFVTVRVVNQRLAPERRIKVWLGEPKIDWSKIHTFPELQPYLPQRDPNYARIIRDEIMAKKKKALLIIGTGHIFGMAPLPTKLAEEHLEPLATVVPFTGYAEKECDQKFAARAQDKAHAWPVPAIIIPRADASLKSVVDLPGCSFLKPEEIARIKAIPPDKLPEGYPSTEEMLRRYSRMISGEDADAILYLGPKDTLTESMLDPAIYIDPEYFKEQDRRRSCCTTQIYRGNLDVEQLLQRNAVSPRKMP